MENPVLRQNVLAVNQEAQARHEAALVAGLGGEYLQANKLFFAAQVMLAPETATLDVTVQAAHILRDDGFTCVRRAIAENNTDWVGEGREVLERSRELTKPFLTSKAIAEATETMANGNTPERILREVEGQHGATVSLLGRTATVNQVLLGVDTRQNNQVSKAMRAESEELFAIAHTYTRRGNNGYYRVSNAMVAARQERLNGRGMFVMGWLGRAAGGMVWTAFKDRQNFKRAALTAGSRSRDLRSYSAAIKSTIHRP